MPASVDEVVVRVADICEYKWDMVRNRPWAYVLSGVAGGAMVVFGATLALAVSAGVPENLAPGLANLLMGLVFMFSLVIIMVSGMSLVTADMYIGVIWVFHRRITWGWFVWGVLLGYVGNFLGSMFFMWLVSMSGPYGAWPWLARSHAMGVAKLGYPALEIFVMGMPAHGCCRRRPSCTSRPTRKWPRSPLAAYGPLAFVAGMTEHTASPTSAFWPCPCFSRKPTSRRGAGWGLTRRRCALGFGQYGWAHNQLYTVLGNIVGGVLFVGVVFQLVSNPRRVMERYAEKKSFMIKL
jgi:formate/nitrite transporter FocA (FNT family)